MLWEMNIVRQTEKQIRVDNDPEVTIISLAFDTLNSNQILATKCEIFRIVKTTITLEKKAFRDH